MSRRNRRTRDNISISNHRLRSASDSLYSSLGTYSRLRDLTSQRLRNLLSTYEDRRTFHPLGVYRPARSFSGLHHRLVLSPYKKAHKTLMKPRVFRTFGNVVSFHQPSKTLICVRRRQRREVLHAFNRTGRGSGQRYPRRSWYSSVRC